VALIGAGIVIGATVRGGAVVADPRIARVAVRMAKRHDRITVSPFYNPDLAFGQST